MTTEITASNLLAQLIKCPSVTPDDGGAIDIIINALEPYGFSCHKLIFGGDINNSRYGGGGAPITNLFATIGSGRPHIAFAGHTDVVPAGNLSAWKYPPFSGTIAEGGVHGRGAVDMKGAITCFIDAITGIIAAKTKITGTISLIITGDEEGIAINGTEKLLRWMADNGHRLDGCLLGEPTCTASIGDTIKVGRRGSVSGLLTVYGRQGHVAYPDLANNPIPAMINIIQALTAKPLDVGNKNFQPSNLEITAINTDNLAVNVIPGEIKVKLNIRFNDLWSSERLVSELHQRIKTAKVNRVNNDYILEINQPASEPFVAKGGSLHDNLIEAIRQTTTINPVLSTTGGTSDARFIKDYCPVIEFGLIANTMHQINEWTKIDDLNTLTRVYSNFLRKTMT